MPCQPPKAPELVWGAASTGGSAGTPRPALPPDPPHLRGLLPEDGVHRGHRRGQGRAEAGKGSLASLALRPRLPDRSHRGDCFFHSLLIDMKQKGCSFAEISELTLGSESTADSTVERLCRCVWGLGLLKGFLERDRGDGRVGSGQWWSRCRGGRPLDPRPREGSPGCCQARLRLGQASGERACRLCPPLSTAPGAGPGGARPRRVHGEVGGGDTGGLPSPGCAGIHHTHLLQTSSCAARRTCVCVRVPGTRACVYLG